MFKPLLLLLVMTLMYRQASGQNFKCFPNQTIHFENPDSAIYTYFTAFYDEAGTVSKCISTSDVSKDNIYLDCASTTATVTVYISDRSLSDDILGGKDAQAFAFCCSPIDSYMATFSSNFTYSGTNTNKTEEMLTNTFDIIDALITNCDTNDLTQFDFLTNVTETIMGGIVFLIISSPADHDVVPLQCNATGSGGESVTVKYDCSDVANLATPLIVKAESEVTICNNTLYVYKFYSPDSLVVECDVNVTVDGDLPEECDIKRKRRSIGDDDTANYDDIKHISVTRRWTIMERTFGGSDQSRGSILLTLGLSIFIGVLKMG